MKHNALKFKWIIVFVITFLDLTSPQIALAAVVNLPGYFMKNEGQFQNGSKYCLKSPSSNTFFYENYLIHQIITESENSKETDATILNLKISFKNYNQQPIFEERDTNTSKSNFFIGNDPSNWRTDVASFNTLVYKNLYNNTDLIYYNSNDGLKSDFVIRKGGNPSDIILSYNGIQKLSVNQKGELELTTAAGLITENIPEAYQIIRGKKVLVKVSYIIENEYDVRFHVENYNTNFELVIDPQLIYCSYFGGTGDDFMWSGDIEKDATGNIYFTGRTTSFDFPVTVGSYSNSNSGGYDVFAVKMNPQGTQIIFSTYIGGPGNDYGYGLELSGSGNDIVITGVASSGFPVTTGSYQTTYQGGSNDAFILKLNNQGNTLLFSTYLGGSMEDYPFQVTLDLTQNIYITGQTNSDFPTTAGAYQTVNGGGAYDIFVSKLNSTGTTLLNSTMIGLNAPDRGLAIALDASNNVYITGLAQGIYPTTAGCFDNSFNGGNYDIVVSKFNPTLSTLLYSTFLGTSGEDMARSALYVDNSNNAIVFGKAGSGFPTTSGAYQQVYGGGATDGIIVKLNASGSSLVYSTYLGGNGDDYIINADLSVGTDIVITGFAGNNFPITNCAYDDSYNGGVSDAFVAKLNSTVSQLLYSSYLGGSNIDQGMAILAYNDSVFIVGETKSSNLPVTANAYDLTFNGGGNDLFLAKMSLTSGSQATANAGSDQTICENNSYTISSATASNYTSLQWTSSGTGTFNNPSIINPFYTPSVADILAGSVTLTLTPSSGTSCPGVPDAMVLTIQKSPLVNAGQDATVCQGDSFTITTAGTQNTTGLLWTSSGSGTLTGSTGLNPTYTPGLNETGNVTLNLSGIGISPCGNATDNMVITIITLPVINAGADINICETASSVSISGATSNSAGILNWITSGTGTFSSNTILNPIYTPSPADIASGSVILTLTATSPPCADVTDQLTVNISQTALANAGPDNSTCQSQPFTLTGASASNSTSVNWSSNGLGFLSNSTTLTPVYTPAIGETGVVTLTLSALSALPCTAMTDFMLLTINPSPVAIAGNDATICSGSTYTISGASVSNNFIFSWSENGTGSLSNTGALSPTYIPGPGETGTVTITLSAAGNPPCSIVTDALILTINPIPIANAGPAGSICSGATYPITNATAQNHSSVLWTHNGAGNLTPIGSLSPTYTPGSNEIGIITFTLTAFGIIPCDPVQSQTTLTIVPAVAVNAGADASTCRGNPFTISSANVSNSVSYTWMSNGSGTLSNNTLLTPTYTPSAGETGSVTLTISATGNSPCPVITDAMQLFIQDYPTAFAGNNASICQNTSYTVPNATASNYSAYSWSHSGTGNLTGTNTLSPTYQPGINESGIVAITLTSNGFSNCLPVSHSMNLTIDPLPIANAGPDDASCQGFPFTVSGASAANESTLQWVENGTGSLINPGTLTPAYTPAPFETGVIVLTLKVAGSQTCSADTAADTRILNINPLPNVIAGTDNSFCASDSYSLSGLQNDCSTFLWSSSGDGSFSNNSILNAHYNPGPNDILTGSVLLTLTGQGSGECGLQSDMDQVALTIDPMPTVFAGNDEALCVKDPILISGAAVTNFGSLNWTGGDGTFSSTDILSPSYMPGGVDFTNGNVNLTLTANGMLTCASKTVSDVRNFSVTPFPVVFAGTDDYICSDKTLYQLSANAQHIDNSTIQWTFSGGDGSFNNSALLNPIYFPGPIDLTTINRQIIFTLSANGFDNCASTVVSDPVQLLIDPIPIPNAGPDGSVCGRSPYTLVNDSAIYQQDITWSSSGDGIFVNNAVLHPVYIPGPTDQGKIILLTMHLLGCKALISDDFMWLTVHPDPSARISGTTDICEGTSTPVNIVFTGTPPWDVTYTDGINPINIENITSSPYTFTVSPTISTTWSIISASDAFCNTPVDSIHGLATISVNPLPDPFLITASNEGFYCEGDSGVIIGLNNSQTGMNYSLFKNGISIVGPVPGNGFPLSFGLFSMPGQYYVQAQNPVGNCLLIMRDTINVIMNPIPVTDFTSNKACSEDTTHFNISSNYIQKVSSWHWAFGDGTFATYNAPYSPSHVYPTYGIYKVILSVEDTNGCQYTVSHPVEVKPHPTAFFSIGTPNCLGNLTQFTDLSGNPAGEGYVQTWIWDFGDGSPKDTIYFPDSPNVMHHYATQGNYNVHLTILNSRGCSDEFQQVVSVTNRPIAAFTSWSSCEDKVATFVDNSDANLGGQITSWNWNFGEPTSGTQNFSTFENPVHTYSTPGNFVVTLIITNLNGCSDTIQNTVNVKSKPLSNFFSSPGCVNSETQFLADSTLINTGATAIYQWNFGDGETSFSQYASHSYVASGTYYVTLTVTDTAGCVGDTILPVIVNPPPTAHFSSNTDNCQGQAVAFANQSVSNSGFITTWEWDFGDGNTQTVTFPDPPNVNHTYAGTGTFNVTLTVTNNEGCSHFETRTVNSLGAPSADFMSSGQCAGTAVNFTDLTSVTGNQVLDNWSWNFGDPTSGINNTSIFKNPSHIFATAGNYTVQLITFTGNNCSDTISKTVTVKPIPAVDFTAQSACANNPALFAPAGVAVNTISSWYWTFGDGGSSNEQAPTHSYTSPGTYTVTLTITDTAGCSNTISKPLIIAPLPDANFSFSTPTCKDDAVSFTDFSSAVTGYVARWTWDFGDGNIQNILFPANPSVTHQYANAGTFNVILTVKTNDSCTNQLTRVVTILPKPTAAFAYGAACQGNSVTFNDQSISNTTGAISGWNWNFGDPTSGTSNNSSLQHPTHIYSTAGTYTAQLIVSIPGGCSDTITHQITVSPPPAVDFTPVAGCNGDTTQFTATVNSATTQGYYWQFGDGGTSFIANPIHVYATAGTFTVTLTITDTAGCTNVKVKPVTVIPGPVAAFSSSSPGCSGLPITFTDLSNANGGTITSWYWDFGDGTDTTFTFATSSFAHTYAQPGTFAAKLTVFSAAGCENLKQQMVTISPSPLAAFDYENTCQGQSTQFTDLTNLNGGSSLTQRVWNFGDPNSGILNTSTQTNPVHTYTLPGTYIVTLVTLNGGGCVDTIQQNVSITPKPGVDFYNDSLVCFGNTITLFTDTTVANIAALSYFEWDFGDGSPNAFTQNASHQYNVAGTFIVTLTVQDTAGCENFISRPITIYAKPNPQFTYLGICENATTQFTDQSLAPQGDTITNWLWEFMQGATTLGTDTVQNPNFTFNQPGTFSVKLTTFTEHGCNDTKILPVQIWNKPTAYFNYSASPCANGLVTFQDSSWSYQGLVNSWQWEFEPYQYGTGTHPSHQYYAVDSCYAVTLMIEDLRGCMDTVVQQICVPPALSVDFNTELTCLGSPVTFTPELVTPAAPADSLITFSWNFGDPTTGNNNVSTQKTPAHNFSSVGFYTVSFSTTDKFGCTASNYKTVQVNALPVANFSYTTGQCDSTLIFSSTSIDTSSTINTYIWQYGDGNSDTLSTPGTTHKYSMPGEYLASLTIINGNGCTATHSATVTRSACLVAATMSIESLMCQNQIVSFADMSTCDGTISQWDWNFGDGSPSESYTTFKTAVTHTFANPGPYTISLKVSTLVGTSTISDSTTMDIVVKPTPVAGFSSEAVCLGTKTEFSDTTQSNGANMLYYRWEFGDEGDADTSNLKNPEYLYSVAGIYSPELIVQNEFGCADTITSNLTVNGLPDAGYANSLACAGQKTYFFDASQHYVDPLAIWGWYIDDSMSRIGYMTGVTPTFTFDSTGTYHVMLTVADINGCADTLIQYISVNPAPVSAFSYTENVEEIQGQVQFTNGTIGAKEYYWDFGNGAISYEDSPLITYADDGLYNVMLVSVSNEGCHDTTMITYELMFKGLYVPNAIAPGGTIQATRIWKPVGVNLATYTAEIYNSHGMLLWKSTLLDENGAPAESWDGTYNDKPCQQDVYVWKITAVYRDGSIWYNTDVGEREGLSEPKWGTVTVIR